MDFRIKRPERERDEVLDRREDGKLIILIILMLSTLLFIPGFAYALYATDGNSEMIVVSVYH